MPRWLFITICTLFFAAPVGAAILLAWPMLIDRPHPIGLDTDAGILVAFTLVFSAAIAILMTLHIQNKRRA